MRSRHPRTAALFAGMGVVLLVAVVVGQQVGERTIFGATERRVVIPDLTVTPIPEDTGTDEAISRNWQRLQVVSVATDPHFPDPRVTPPPSPSPKPTRTPNAAIAPTPAVPSAGYTSPPLPLPIASHDPAEMPTQ
jgi:hypothetical protein